MKDVDWYVDKIKYHEAKVREYKNQLKLRTDSDLFNDEGKQQEPTWYLIEKHPWISREALSAVRQKHDIDPPGGYKR